MIASTVQGIGGKRWTLEEARDLLGHSSITVTERYAHLAQSRLGTMAERYLRALEIRSRFVHTHARELVVEVLARRGGGPRW